MGLMYQTTRWLDRLWSEHLEHSKNARELVELGIRKQGATFAGFPADLHARLYLPADPPRAAGTPPSWAEHVHARASELPEWRCLKSMCARNGFAAGIATEALLERLVHHIPDQPDLPNTSTSDTTPASDDAALRAALRRAVRHARDTVETAESQLDGIATSIGILSTATRQKRPWHLVAFNQSITHEVSIKPGTATAEDIQSALDHSCSGGTDFDAPVTRACELIEQSRTLRQADVIIITDGEDDLDESTIASANELTKREGVSFYVIGVGPTAERCAASLGPIATSIVRVTNTDDAEPILPIVTLDENAA